MSKKKKKIKPQPSYIFLVRKGNEVQPGRQRRSALVIIDLRGLQVELGESVSPGAGALPPPSSALGHNVCFASLLAWRWFFLPLRPDLVSQDEIGDEPQGDEEDAQDDEIQVQLRVLHVQLPQDGL